MKLRRGFTLLELVIVIVIVGVLASLALPRFGKMVERSRATEALSVLGSLRNTMEICYVTTRNYLPCGPVMDTTATYLYSPNRHFDFVGYYHPDGYELVLRRNARELLLTDPGGTAVSPCGGFAPTYDESYVMLCATATKVGIAGSGFYEGIR